MDNQIYIDVLKDSLIKKVMVLDKLLEKTLLQEKIISTSPFSSDEFDQAYEDKEILILQLSELDEGFEQIYDHVKEILGNNKFEHKEDIIQLQNVIRQITDKSTELQSIEIRNKKKLDILFTNRKKEIKDYKINSQTASSYYKNMTDQHQGQSYFYDKKK
ncbi:MAG TPA: flagellar protein FliT [Clostridiales bacterium]|nr:flagellar protein FliT [Clostridiales bacterium]